MKGVYELRHELHEGLQQSEIGNLRQIEMDRILEEIDYFFIEE